MNNLLLEKVLKGKRLSQDEIFGLFQLDLLSLANIASQVKQRKHSHNMITYIIDRNINYSNICVSGCKFCAFYRKKDDPESYTLAKEEIFKKIDELISKGGCQILMQGGLHPDHSLDFYEDLVREIKARFDIHIHAFSPPEIVHIANISSLSIEDVIVRLKDAGLGSIPGGGAEILSNKIRKRISPNKCTADDWINVMRLAHKIGLRTTATMMFGHIETLEDRVVHLLKIRELQDETGGFTAFIPWTFQPKNTQLKRASVSSYDYLRTLAISRIALENFENIQASWVTQGDKIAQIALFFGANDMGSTMLEENVVRAAGVSFQMTEAQICRLIEDIGLIPRRRDTLYNLL
ncbi:MAG TPA: cyclic dehypoxanthinyl futalosine synthase [Nitrospinota bacterium]|nr:cyclic dehypoxanthinyl futalosine synthase [Nitrospinota bacterium]